VILMAITAACGSNPASPTQPSSTATVQSNPTGGPPVVEPPEGPGQQPPASGGTATITAVGDIGWCGSPAVAQTATLASRFSNDLLLLGDLAYPSGTADDFRRCFDPSYGRLRRHFRPLPGNHDYDVANGDGYYTYMGDAAGADRTGYYAFRAATWQVLMLNSSAPIGRGSPQYMWVAEQLQRPSRCTLAAVHHPFSSSGMHGDTQGLRDVWQLLMDADADVMLAGHDHDYERFAPMNADRRLDLDRGIRQFTVGTGGAPLYPRTRQAANSEVFLTAWGVLRLSLQPTQYEWEFLDVAGLSLDRGAAPCH
jgi:alkaline phosphatase